MKTNKEFTDSIYKKYEAAKALEESGASAESETGKVIEFTAAGGQKAAGTEKTAGKASKKKIYRYVGTLAACLLICVGVASGTGVFSKDAATQAVMNDAGAPAIASEAPVMSESAAVGDAKGFAPEPSPSLEEESAEAPAPAPIPESEYEEEAADAAMDIAPFAMDEESDVDLEAKNSASNSMPAIPIHDELAIDTITGDLIGHCVISDHERVQEILNWLASHECMDRAEFEGKYGAKPSDRWPETYYVVSHYLTDGQSVSGDNTDELIWIVGDFPYAPEPEE